MPHGPWFLTRDQPGTATLSGDGPLILCFPHAGGNSRTFLGWQPALEGIELAVVGMPGRGHRAGEAALASIAAVADGAAEAISRLSHRHIVLFGHSLGALIAFEVARRLRASQALRHLVASGCSAPSLLPSARVVAAAALEGREFAEAVGFFGGLPQEVVAAEELHDLLLPALQADFRLVAGYQYRSAEPLAIGLSLINGRADPHVRPPMVEPWARETTTPPVPHWADGGHFYFETDPSAVTSVLRALVPTGIPAGHHVELI